MALIRRNGRWKQVMMRAVSVARLPVPGEASEFPSRAQIRAYVVSLRQCARMVAEVDQWVRPVYRGSWDEKFKRMNLEVVS